MMARSTFYSVNFDGWPPVHVKEWNDPNSLYWKDECEIAAKRFDKLPLSQEDWQAFHDLMKGQMLTRKRGHEIYTEAISAFNPGVALDWLAWSAGILPEPPECTCNVNSDACPVCVVQARTRAGEELPY